MFDQAIGVEPGYSNNASSIRVQSPEVLDRIACVVRAHSSSRQWQSSRLASLSWNDATLPSSSIPPVDGRKDRLPRRRSSAQNHPVRLQIVRILLRGPANAANLHAIVEVGSSCQIYQHLERLSSASIVEQRGRGDYRIAAERVVPLLVSTLAAADIAGDPGT